MCAKKCRLSLASFNPSPKQVNTKMERKVIWIVSKQALFSFCIYTHSFHMNKTLVRHRIIEGLPEPKLAVLACSLCQCDKKKCCKKYEKGKKNCKSCPKR